MGFGTDLQGKKSHEALLRIQDAEIKLLENIKRCITIKAECDKKYANSLSTMVQQAQKMEHTEFHSCGGVFQVRNVKGPARMKYCTQRFFPSTCTSHPNIPGSSPIAGFNILFSQIIDTYMFMYM